MSNFSELITHAILYFVPDARAIIGIDDINDTATLYKCVASEFIGTMLLVFLGTAEGVVWTSSTDIVQISLTTGFYIALIVIVCKINA